MRSSDKEHEMTDEQKLNTQNAKLSLLIPVLRGLALFSDEQILDDPGVPVHIRRQIRILLQKMHEMGEPHCEKWAGTCK